MHTCNTCKYGDGRGSFWSTCKHIKNKYNVKEDIGTLKYTDGFPEFNEISLACHIQREHGYILCRLFNQCGKEGRWWEAKRDPMFSENEGRL